MLVNLNKGNFDVVVKIGIEAKISLLNDYFNNEKKF